MLRWSGKLNRKLFTFVKFALLLAGLVCILVFATSYFSVSIFTFDGHKYKPHLIENDRMQYQSFSGDQIEIRIHTDGREVIVGEESYFIEKRSGESARSSYVSSPDISYSVKYPNGRQLEVRDQRGRLRAFDEAGEIYFPVTIYANGQRQKQPGEETYHPSSLVRAAYPAYHTNQGSPWLFAFSIFLLILGWCQFRYEAFQRVLFWLSLKWIWVEDPEPNDFYFFMSKVGGIVLMGASVVFAFKSFLA